MNNPSYEESVFGHSYPKVPAVSRFSGRGYERFLRTFITRSALFTNNLHLTEYVGNVLSPVSKTSEIQSVQKNLVS